MRTSAEPRTIETDVVIVGAGIAGTSLAYLLARSGVDTVLMERHTNLAREFRGFGFQPLALRFFDGMDVLDEVHALNPVHVEKIQIHAFGSSYTVADPTTYPDHTTTRCSWNNRRSWGCSSRKPVHTIVSTTAMELPLRGS